MYIKCINNKGLYLPEDCLHSRGGYGRDCNFDLQIGQGYVVYAMAIFFGYVWYFIDTKFGYPFHYPSPLFSVIDGKLSKYWLYNFTNAKSKTEMRFLWAFPEWSNDKYYYNLLTDLEPQEVEVYKIYKHLMDIEFPNPSIKMQAEILDDSWLMCPSCIDAWESKSNNGMVICPKCNQMMHNPRYKS